MRDKITGVARREMPDNGARCSAPGMRSHAAHAGYVDISQCMHHTGDLIGVGAHRLAASPIGLASVPITICTRRAGIESR